MRRRKPMCVAVIVSVLMAVTARPSETSADDRAVDVARPVDQHVMAQAPTARLARYDLFTAESSRRGVTIVAPDRGVWAHVRNDKGGFLVTQFPLGRGQFVDLELERFHVTGPNTKVVVGRKGGADIPFDFDPSSVVLLRGNVVGHPSSDVFLALSDRLSTGHVDLGLGSGRYRVSSRMGAGRNLEGGKLAVFEASKSGNGPPPQIPLCGLDALLGGAARTSLAQTEPLTRGTQHFQLAVETDYEFYQLFGNLEDAATYLVELFGAVSHVYLRDVNVWVELSYWRLWNTGNDLFNEPNPLYEFRDYWNAFMGSVERDAAQFVSGRRNLPYGGIAWVGALCGNYAYSVVGYIVGSFPEPELPSSGHYDVGVTAHELGHNFGAYHTHDYGIDACNDFDGVPQRGTIMSYCSQTYSGGASNEDHYFHSYVQGEMEHYIAIGASCVRDDCNRNGIVDSLDISDNQSDDDNGNGTPDECEDCNNNGILDDVDIAGGSPDVNGNGIPDGCEPDCNDNGVPDEWDIWLGTSTDVYGNNIPDVCDPDCDGDYVADYNEIQADMSLDLDRNLVLDACQDCDGDGTTDFEALEGAYNAWVASYTRDEAIREFHADVGTVVQISDAGHISAGQDLVISSDRRIFVTGGGDDRVVEFDRNGNYVADFVSTGSGGLDYPTGLTFGPNGNLFVSSFNTNSVIEYDGSTGALVGTFVAPGSGGLISPFGLVFGPSGNLFVASSDNQVLKYSGATGAFLRVFVSSGNNGGLTVPRGMAFKPDRNLLVASFGSDQVLEYNGTTGLFIGQFNNGGTDVALRMDEPWGVRIGPNGHVFVSRHDERLVAAQDSDGEALHLNATRIYMFDIDNGNFLRSYVTGNDTGMIDTTGFDFMPGQATDCNMNLMPDRCDIIDGTSLDENGNDTPDECECFSSSPPVAEMLNPPPLEGTGDVLAATGPGEVNVKNRFVSIMAGDPGRIQAIRVTFVSLPSPFDIWNGMQLFAGQPIQVCENSGQGPTVPIADCGHTGGILQDWFWAAPLVCHMADAHLDSWSTYGVIHLYHEGLVPEGVYEVQVVDSVCSLQQEASYSDPLTMTQARWADVCGPSDAGSCTTTPDGTVDTTNDILGLLGKFENTFPVQKARADLVPGDNGMNNGPDFLVTVANEVLLAIEAFTGAPYAFVPGEPCEPGFVP